MPAEVRGLQTDCVSESRTIMAAYALAQARGLIPPYSPNENQSRADSNMSTRKAFYTPLNHAFPAAGGSGAPSRMDCSLTNAAL